MQDGLLTVYDQCVACVMSALEANHGSRLLSEQVNNFALALITPLRAEHNHITTHYFFSTGFSRHFPSIRTSCCEHRGSMIPPRDLITMVPVRLKSAS